MDWDDEYDNGYNDMGHASHRDNSMSEKGSSDGGLDFKDIANPVSAYFFLSDDVQDEISGSHKKKMKCGSCGHRFAGDSYESCPECFSPDTEETVKETEDGYW
jgi:rubrerythrin